MYIANERRPVIASLTSADAEFNHWVAENSYHQLADMAGSIWKLELRMEQFPHPENVLSSLYRLHVSIATAVGAETLVSTGILHPTRDARLLAMFGDELVPIPIKTKVIEARTLETLRSDLASYIYKLRNELKKRDLSKLKRRLVGQWIDRKSLFGHALSRPPDRKIDLDV